MIVETEIRNFFDISIEHFPDRSARWLLQDKENVRGLIEIVASELVETLDFSQLVQINRSFISDTLREQESDIVFRVLFHSRLETDELLIYILIEHQSTVDASMGFRVLFYMTQIWDSQRQEWESGNVPKSQWRLRPSAITYLLLLILHRRPMEEHEDLITLVDEHTHGMEVETMAQSIIELSERRGERRGEKRGETRGETRAKREAILKLIRFRFNSVPDSVTTEIASIRSLSRLDSLFEKALAAKTLDEIDLLIHDG